MPTEPDRPAVSVVVVPRERPSTSLDSLRSIFENTSYPFELVYVDCPNRFSNRDAVRRLVESRGGTYIRSPKYLYPNEARNLGIDHASPSSEHLVFIDNDVFVDPGWLEALVDCADQPDVGVVGPLYLEGDRHARHVHCAGGEISLQESAGGRPTLYTQQYELGLPVSELPDLEREPTELIEFHCVLVTRACLDAIGGEFDPDLLTTREHVDLCLLARDAGFDVYLEPESRVGYGKEEPMALTDLPYFLFRWSDRATRKTIAHFEAKWDVDLDPPRRRIIGVRRAGAVRDVMNRYGLGFVEPYYLRLRPHVPTKLRPFEA
jgi:GT2 family glycosyltransferase